ncbi:HNH endonuclease signature motif containing protein [Branchiibius sp. NY16-3462-2]|uniref:HNH endonuclease signature motif containing protein n=1 Tax=Branchiibius sp. NY16-3462-2 TaxID=1807500 RepID=UPI00079A89F6|nr:HNH endonuclease signature motif containing protein [Branchiibius sp. NY16-3462-2]KYH43498.1 hypothetical protein AZH51_17270 [Branchiibius sp. NY16-3462-2]
MGGGTGFIAESVIAAAPVADLLDEAHRLLVAVYGKVAAGGGALSQDGLVGEAVLAQQVQNSAWAIQSRRLAQAAAISERLNGVSGAGTADLAHEWFPLEVATRLGWTDRQAGARLGQACEATGYTSGLLDLAGAGELESRKVTAVASVTAGSPGHVAAEIEARILEGDPVGTTSSKLAAKARRLLTKLDPVAADEASQDRRRGSVGVFVHPHHEPGLSEVTAVMPTLDAAKLIAVIDEHARELQVASTTDKTLAESRVDALTDLVMNGAIVDTQLTLLIPLAEPAALIAEPEPTRELVGARGGAQPPPVPGVPAVHRSVPPPGMTVEDWWDYQGGQLNDLDTQVEELIAYERGQWPDGWPPPQLANATRQRRSDGHGHGRAASAPGRGLFEDVLLPRVGVIPGAAIEELVQVLGIQLSRALANPLTGTIAETGDKTYRPGAGLARFVRARDQHCRFPGCTHPAERCDLDHVVRYPDGPTAARNLQPLCRHHHRAKHEGGWKVSMTPDGVCTWTSPTGRIYITRPAD